MPASAVIVSMPVACSGLSGGSCCPARGLNPYVRADERREGSWLPCDVRSLGLSIDSGDVWMGGGCGGSPQWFALVNSSVHRLQQLLKLWESFMSSARSEVDDDYDDFVAGLLEQARQADPAAFADESAWFNVFDEVELGVLRPE
jgi:hypothetical protein